MRGAFATFAVIAAVVLAGCTSTPGHPDPTTAATPAPTPTTTPAVSDPPDTGSAPTSPPPVTGTDIPTDVPTTGPNLRHKGERPPAMPLLATQHTRAGAVAFAQFFIQTIDWGFATTSSAYMRHYYAPSCIGCDNHARGLDATRKAGDRYVGGRFTINDATTTSTSSDPNERSVVVTFTITAGEVLNKHDAFITGEEAHINEQRLLSLAWRHNGWVVVDLAPTK